MWVKGDCVAVVYDNDQHDVDDFQAGQLHSSEWQQFELPYAVNSDCVGLSIMPGY